MTLIELLCVIAIIALLAALLLPAVSQAKARAWRIQCVDHLHQTGIGFASFAHDHNGHFPMAVPASAGGSLEYAQSGYQIDGDFCFSYCHFQAASNELVTPRLLVCPADTRLPACCFATLSNANLSYFVGVNADLARPTSVLAGDRNLTNDYAGRGTMLQLGFNNSLRWTVELDRFKGNLLFSDGHVEEKNGRALNAVGNQVPPIANLALPTVPQGTIPVSSPGGRTFPGAPGAPSASGTSSAGSVASAENAQAFTERARATRPAVVTLQARESVWPKSGAAEDRRPPRKVERGATYTVIETNAAWPQEETTNSSPLNASQAVIAEVLTNKGVRWLGALLLLVLAAALVLCRLVEVRNKQAVKPTQRFR